MAGCGLAGNSDTRIIFLGIQESLGIASGFANVRFSSFKV